MSWDSWLLSHEMQIRLLCFFGIFLIMAFWESAKPCRSLSLSRWLRWSNNLSLVVLNSVILRLLFPAAAVGMAHYAETEGFGLFNLLSLPFVVEVVLAVIILDLLIYAQHVVFHKVPILWRLHRVHHADPDYDLTTGVRFHPIEIVLSMLIKFIAVIILGPAAVAVLLFEILLNGSAMFNHANIQLPERIDRIVRAVFVTPDMHRVHHSWIREETDSNYGFALAWWDRIFSTYRQSPEKGQLNMDIGLKEFRDPNESSQIFGMLKIPFVAKR